MVLHQCVHIQCWEFCVERFAPCLWYPLCKFSSSRLQHRCRPQAATPISDTEEHHPQLPTQKEWSIPAGSTDCNTQYRRHGNAKPAAPAAKQCFDGANQPKSAPKICLALLHLVPLIGPRGRLLRHAHRPWHRGRLPQVPACEVRGARSKGACQAVALENHPAHACHGLQRDTKLS